MIKQCWGIHDNGCTEPAMHGSVFCKECGDKYWESCAKARMAAEERSSIVMNPTWRTDNPPKDGTSFIGCVEGKRPSEMVYSCFDCLFCATVLEVQKTSNGDEVWFENAAYLEGQIKAWMPMPEAYDE